MICVAGSPFGLNSSAGLRPLNLLQVRLQKLASESVTLHALGVCLAWPHVLILPCVPTEQSLVSSHTLSLSLTARGMQSNTFQQGTVLMIPMFSLPYFVDIDVNSPFSLGLSLFASFLSDPLSSPLCFSRVCVFACVLHLQIPTGPLIFNPLQQQQLSQFSPQQSQSATSSPQQQGETVRLMLKISDASSWYIWLGCYCLRGNPGIGR